jgi:hypothetical protein
MHISEVREAVLRRTTTTTTITTTTCTQKKAKGKTREKESTFVPTNHFPESWRVTLIELTEGRRRVLLCACVCLTLGAKLRLLLLLLLTLQCFAAGARKNV